ncbi:hypothetical protein [Methylobacterium indicum]|uniref:Uncharacterized protein n=1 Tax=Methylobacterium indicum TaxID=1775910 RepID=A0A8H8WUP1_9HYPH|nr:hypothetical protein [Methylobacterium indicum]BCM84568.1 hypothetical protein mvi_30290 [Methylobacterium indicum]
MAHPLPLLCRAAAPEAIRIDVARRRRPAPRLPVAMLVRSLVLIAGLGLPVAAATLADLAHPAPALSRPR